MTEVVVFSFRFYLLYFSISDLQSSGVKAVLTLGVLVIAAILSVIIAKLFQHCRKHNILFNDEESYISEHTRNIMRTRLSIIQFKHTLMKRARRKPKTREFFWRWVTQIRMRKQGSQVNVTQGKEVQNGDLHINVQTKETDSKWKVVTRDLENGVVIKQNGVNKKESNCTVEKEKTTPKMAPVTRFTRNTVTESGRKPEKNSTSELQVISLEEDTGSGHVGNGVIPTGEVIAQNQETPRVTSNYTVAIVEENGKSTVETKSENGVKSIGTNGLSDRVHTHMPRSKTMELNTTIKNSVTKKHPHSAKPIKVSVAKTNKHKSAEEKT